ncbi:MAG: HAMP domain-containing histidine kinase [Clostridiales bacterium]|nr:HAMP domain-containing histidine kinase [Clostridiales bacterium]
MITRLRRKFIIISMLSVTLVLAVLIAAINIFNFRKVVRNSDETLEMLIANEGSFPDEEQPGGKPPEDRNNGGGRRGNQMSPEARYETRYFKVVFDNDGDVIVIDTGKIAAVDSSRAAELAREVYSGGKTSGFKGDYRFRRITEDNETLIIFHDCGRGLDNARSFLGISIVISLIGLLIFFALIAVSSKAVTRPAAEAYEKQKRFITDAGHELKTPLAVINADCDVLEMDSGENEWLADIRKQTERLTSLTNSLIFLAKTEEGSRSDVVKIDFPLSDVVTEEVESFNGLAKSSGRNVETSITPDITYNGDQRSVTQLISILMDNAIKYSPEGSVIKVSLNRNGSKVVLSVSNDTEETLTKENTDRMFDRFYRTDESRNSETGGYGIGLSIAKGITEAHGGKIYAAGTENGIVITAEL